MVDSRLKARLTDLVGSYPDLSPQAKEALVSLLIFGKANLEEMHDRSGIHRRQLRDKIMPELVKEGFAEKSTGTPASYVIQHPKVVMEKLTKTAQDVISIRDSVEGKLTEIFDGITSGVIADSLEDYVVAEGNQTKYSGLIIKTIARARKRAWISGSDFSWITDSQAIKKELLGRRTAGVDVRLLSSQTESNLTVATLCDDLVARAVEVRIGSPVTIPFAICDDATVIFGIRRQSPSHVDPQYYVTRLTSTDLVSFVSNAYARAWDGSKPYKGGAASGAGTS